MKERVAEIDIAKGLLILFVLLGHSPVSEWTGAFVNSFHMAAFFFLSGLTYSYKGEIGSFFRKKTKSIFLPYLEFSVILLVLAYGKHVTHAGGGGSFDLRSGIESVFVPISGRTQTTVYGLWFLPCLYLIEILVAASQWLDGRMKNMGWLFCTVVTASCIALYCFTNVASVTSILPVGLVFLMLGTWLKAHLGKVEKHKHTLLFLGLLLYLPAVCLNASFFSKGLDLSSMSLGCLPLYLLSCLGGTLVVLALAHIVGGKVISLIGRNSLYYYGLHYCIIGIVGKMVGGVWCMLLTLLLTTPLVFGFKYIRKQVRFL